MTKLLSPVILPHIGQLKNRIVMTSMTRGFANDHCCTKEMRDYYIRRAEDGVGLILTEGVVVHPTGDGYNNVPHMWEEKHAESWKETLEDVHRFGSKIACQLWHCGRISHQDYTGGERPVSSTDRAAEGINRQNGRPYAKPRRLTVDEMDDILAMYTHSGNLALQAGFDFIELHLGHGYLVDQFLDARINDRTDEYGGSVKNRCRLSVDLVRKVVSLFSPEKVMVRLSPSRDMNGLYDWPDLDQMLRHLISSFDESGLKMLDISCARADYFQTSGRIIRMIRRNWPHLIFGGASLSADQAESEISEGLLDLVTWGRYILANPDFVTRTTKGLPLVEYSPEMLQTLL